MGWHVKTPLIIEFSSSVVLKWLLNREVRLRLLRNLLIGIDRSIIQLVNVTFSMDNTKGNGMATVLAIAENSSNAPICIAEAIVPKEATKEQQKERSQSV
ncbi:hypothetical protein Gotur_017427 [Gossypium turneri]